MTKTPPEPAAPYLREELDARSLHFSMAAIQSRMDLRAPDALTLEYTRLMMGWLMLRPEARRLAMVGLGGGSIAKFCHRHLPRTTLLAIEVDPRVIALREAFHLPPDDARLAVIEACGAQFIATTDARFEVLLLDAFDAEGMPAALGTQRFYDDCADVLAPDGLLVANLHAGDPRHALHLERIARSFAGELLCVHDHDGSNDVVFAARRGRLAAGARHRPAVLGEAPRRELRGAFARIAAALEAQRRTDPAPQAKRSAP